MEPLFPFLYNITWTLPLPLPHTHSILPEFTEDWVPKRCIKFLVCDLTWKMKGNKLSKGSRFSEVQKSLSTLQYLCCSPLNLLLPFPSLGSSLSQQRGSSFPHLPDWNLCSLIRSYHLLILTCLTSVCNHPGAGILTSHRLCEVPETSMVLHK